MKSTSMMRTLTALLTTLSVATLLVEGFTPSHPKPSTPKAGCNIEKTDVNGRRDFVQSGFVAASAFFGLSVLPQESNALVKGNAPPPKAKASGDKPKCTNVEECQAQAEIRADEERKLAEESEIPASVTAAGTRYRDMEDGEGGRLVKTGDDVKIYYKVLKLGKRSYDGISGEGTVVFSRGYGLEDDEQSPGSKAFYTIVGSSSNIAALNDALLGMSVGQTRRFAVMPQKGWQRATLACDGGPGGQGAGGDLKTDYVVVPTATMVEQEACFDTRKQPFPTSYAQQRRMAQRFDQSLIMEVQVASFN